MTDRQQRKKESHQRYHKAKMEAFTEIKTRCAVCPDALPPYCLDFHHIDDNKETRIGQMHLHNVPKLADELCKCVVVCANCHRKIHWGNEPCPTTTLSRKFVESILFKHKSKASGVKCEIFQFNGSTCTSRKVSV